MVRKRADPWYKAADRQYPIRVKFILPKEGLYKLDLDLHGWLQANLGPAMWQWGPTQSNVGGQTTAYYFRLLEDAQRFVAAFPQLALADGVAAPIDTTPAESKPHQGWSSLGGRRAPD
jgi:hypothetical protein